MKVPGRTSNVHLSDPGSGHNYDVILKPHEGSQVNLFQSSRFRLTRIRNQSVMLSEIISFVYVDKRIDSVDKIIVLPV